MVPVQTRSGTVSGNMELPRPETKRSCVFGKIPDRDRDRWVWSSPDWVQSVWDRTSPTLTVSPTCCSGLLEYTRISSRYMTTETSIISAKILFMNLLCAMPDNVRTWGSGHISLGSGFGVRGSGFRVRGSGFGVQGSGFRVRMDVASASRSLCRLVLRVQDFSHR